MVQEEAPGIDGRRATKRAPVPTCWNAESLRTAGWSGPMAFGAFDARRLPAEPGVYAVIRADSAPVGFNLVTAAGRFKGRDFTEEVSKLEREWIEGAEVLYIGKAGRGRGTKPRGIRTRLREYEALGRGMRSGHQGGVWIFQVAGHERLQLWWFALPGALDHEVKRVERELIESFRAAHHGRLPFANRV